jgi:hypothetical protein
VWRSGNDERAKLGVGCEYAVEVDEVGTGRRNEGGQQAQQLQGSQHQVGGSVRSEAPPPAKARRPPQEELFERRSDADGVDPPPPDFAA